MFPLTVETLTYIMAACLFIMGILSLAAGITILVAKVMSGDLTEIAKQTARLAQKGIAEDVAGLVGNASTLLDVVNQMVRTATGVGIFLVLIGFPLIGIAYYLLSQLK
jgi:hypothetical protein